MHSNSEVLQGQKVSSLMCMDQKQWDVEVVTDVLNTRDANLVLSINEETRDTWYWRKEKLGNYSVKSAYALIQEGREYNLMSNNSGFWRKLWNLKIPSKVKHFMWRAINGCLPTRDNLSMKRVAVNNLCLMCSAFPEKTLHILVQCSFATTCL